MKYEYHMAEWPLGYFVDLTRVTLSSCLMDLLKRKAKLTQDDLAERIGTKKSYISRIENGKIDIQLSTLFKIFEEGFGKKIGISVI